MSFRYSHPRVTASFKIILLLGICISGFYLAACESDDQRESETLNRGLNGDPESLDPHYYSSTQAAVVIRDIREGLLTTDPRGNIAPGAAVDWDVSTDGKKYTFHLRPGLRWSNGEAMTADDFKRSFQRLVSPKIGSSNAHMLVTVVNASKIISGSADPASLGVRTVDDMTLEIRLEERTPYFLQLLTHPSMFPVFLNPSVSKNGRATIPVTNGAYKLVRREINSKIVLDRNPYYWGNSDTSIDNVVFHIVDQNAESIRFRSGELQITDSVSENEFAFYKESRPNVLHVAPMLGVYYYGINLENAKFGDTKDLRLALSLAIDRDVLVDKVLGRGELAAYNVVPPGTSSYRNVNPDYSYLTQAERNELARNLIYSLGYSQNAPLNVKLLINTGGGHEKIAAAVQSMWKETLGVTASLRVEEFKVFISNVRAKKGTEIYRLSWTADFNDPLTFLQLFETGNSSNLTGYSNKEVDILIRQARREKDTRQRMALLSKAETIAIKDVPLIPIYYYVSKHLVDPSIEGWSDNILNIHMSRHLALSGRVN